MCNFCQVHNFPYLRMPTTQTVIAAAVFSPSYIEVCLTPVRERNNVAAAVMECSHFKKVKKSRLLFFLIRGINILLRRQVKHGLQSPLKN